MKIEISQDKKQDKNEKRGLPTMIQRLRGPLATTHILFNKQYSPLKCCENKGQSGLHDICHRVILKERTRGLGPKWLRQIKGT